jgi:putative aldouronate transport system substrate-binding protein
MKKIKYLTVLSLIIALVVTLAACSGNSNSNNKNSSSIGKEPTNNSSSNSGGSPAVVDEDPLGQYDPPINVSVVGATGTNVIYVEGESADDNVITRVFKEKMGINFTNKWVVDAAQANQKLNLSITSNDLPDLFKADATQVQRMIKNEQIADLTEVYETYASDLLRIAMEYGDREGFVGASKDGKIYGMPLPVDYYEHVPIMYIRQDWLDALNLKAPTTIDELITVATAFAKNDPDRNGTNDTYGIALDNTMGLGFDGISNAFKAYRGAWIKDDSGKLVYGSTQPQMKEALATMQVMYNEGVFDKEFGAKDWGKTSDDIGAGKGGIYFGAFWTPLYPLKLTLDHTPGSDWKAYPIPAGVDGTVVPKRMQNVSGWLVARKGMDNPEALIKSMNLWAEMWMEGGQYNDLFYQEIQGSEKYKGIEAHQYAKPSFFDDPSKNFEIGKQWVEAVKSNDGSKITHPDGKWKWESYQANDGNGWAFNLYLGEAEAVLANYNGNFQNNEFLGAPTDTMVKRDASLLKLEQETFIEIIMGKSSVDKFDEFVKQWNSLGGEDITAEVNEWANNR